MASPVDTTVKFLHSAMTGAPVMNGVAGSLIAVLDACLVNGFGLKSVDSLVVAGGVATLNIASGHSAEVGTVVLVAGATPTSLNGEQKVTAFTGTQVKFATAAADTTATGTITMKIAPAAGWTKAFAGTNLAAYKMGDPTGTGFYLRVDDTGTTVARVVGYESMSDVNTGIGAFPSAAAQVGGLYWSKSRTADATARPWQIAADGRLLYFARDYYNTAALKSNELTFFGDINSVKSPDPYACGINGQQTNLSGSTPVLLNQLWNSLFSQSNTDQFWIARGYTGLGGSARFIRSIPNPWLLAANVNFISGAGGSVAFPNSADGGLYVAPMSVVDQASLTYRGTFPGYHCTPMDVPVDTFSTKDTLVGVNALPGRVLRALNCMDGAKGVVFFDTTGPWR